MSCKGFGIALKLTFAGNNQFSHPSTYVFVIISAVCIVTQMNYFNKALDQFSTNLVNPIYYVLFTTSTIAASVILFQGFNTSDGVNVASLFCGFLTIFAGVYLLNTARSEFSGILDKLPMHQNGNGIVRASLTDDSRNSIALIRDATLLRAFNEENIGLTELREDSSESDEE
ncbi:hypothetical protein G9A89_013256 [Geosiphon pyriformis]|nr:hypothetical protein G9A89_013256 [Geosiphon pyriformis]